MSANAKRHGLDDGARAFLVDLLQTAGPSGFETRVADLVRDYAAAFADVERDRMGNVFVRANAGADRQAGVMAHMDEIGFIVTRIDEPGLLRIQPIGGWDHAVPVGQRVRVLAAGGEIPGIITRLPIHQLSQDERTAIKLDEVWIDIGVADADEANRHVRAGDPVVLDRTPVFTDAGRLMSGALDNRISVFAALEVVRRSQGADTEVVAILSTREEITSYGAEGAAWRDPYDEIVVLDVSEASDVPGDVHVDEARLGSGPAVVLGARTSLRIGRELLALADEQNIAYQVIAAGRSTGTDADSVMPQQGGTPCGLMLLPARNLHTPGEIVDLGDVEALIELLVARYGR